MTSIPYVGSELELFAEAVHWKSYLRAQLTPYLGADVLEVGAGFGSTTAALCAGTEQSWVCLEPDAELARRAHQRVADGTLPSCCRVEIGTLSERPATERFDTILYVDVLEHIADDREELRRAAATLRDGGYLVVVAPAYPWLFSPFDDAVGHHRRYTRSSLRRIAPAGVEAVALCYLDAAGALASAANRLLLGQRLPTPRQIHVWDRLLVPVSRRVDPLLRHAVGRSVLGVWRRREATS